MQKKLLVEEGLTFAHAVEIAQSMESAAQKTKLLQSTATIVSPTPEMNMLTFRGRADSCYKCGHTDHPPFHCPFNNTQCLTVATQATSSKLAGENQQAVPLHTTGEEKEVATDQENTMPGEEDTIVPSK